MYLNGLHPRTIAEPATQMKIFVHSSLDSVEKEVNDWLATANAELCHITQSQSEKQGRFVFVISVFFKRRYQPCSS